jgi:DNA ligase 1
MWKPMLAWKPEKGAILEDNLRSIKYPVLISMKLDGIRATVQGGRLRSRTLKDIPNINVQRMFANLPEGLDGELIYGEPNAPDVYRNTNSIVMSDDKPADGIRYFVFDKFGPEGFEQRFREIATCSNVGGGIVKVVPHVYCATLLEVLDLESQWTIQGYEGVMIRSLTGLYKQGRSTLKEEYLLKVKRFMDGEAIIIDAYEMMHNDNVAEVNELGRTKRSTKQENLRAAGVLGGFNVRDVETGVEFSVGSGFSAEQKKHLWIDRSDMPGRIIKYKSLPVGVKDKPRHPIFLGFRDKEDM